MRKFLIPITLLIGAAVGLIRAFEWREAWDTELWLMMPWHWLSILLLLCCFAVAVALFLAMRKSPSVAATPTQEDFEGIRALLWADIAAGLVLLVSAALEIRSFIRAQYGMEQVQELFGLIFAILSVFTAICVIVTASAAARGALNRTHSIYMLTPVFWACFWLLRNIGEYAVNPEPLSFLFEMLGVVFTLLALYTAAGFFFYRANVRRTMLYGALGIFFLLVTLLGDGLYYLFWNDFPMGDPTFANLARALFALFHLMAIVHAYGAKRKRSRWKHKGRAGPMYYPYNYPC
ncbi:MAG: hypothetical protein FWE59_00395 [Oscillospiraceae bacterium]|nr:hypothetical protein [Oscillospiraceae bacterium]